MIGNALFVGMGNIILVQIVKENTWLTAWISLVIGLIPIGILIKIMNYEPSLNLIDKIKKILHPILSHIVNFLIFIMITFVFIITVWNVSQFEMTKYLTEIPISFIAFLFIIPIVYSAIKGIETINRTNQFLFFMSLLIHFMITTPLIKYVEISNLKPIFADGLSPIIDGIYKFITYCFVPFIALLIIPKDCIKNKKKASRALLLGYVFTCAIMAHVFFMNMSMVGVNIASMYRYPEYYVIKKVYISSAFDNVENFLSIHWIFNLFAAQMLTMYYSKSYILNIFKIKKEKVKNIVPIVIGIITVIITCFIFPNSTSGNYFMQYYYPYLIGAPLLGIIFILLIIIMFKNHKQKLKKRHF
jgi:spore germination protein KB